MSPAAVGGPHTRASSVHGVGPVGMENGGKGIGTDGYNGINREFAHLDDLTAARANVSINSSMRTLLQVGDSCARQAETHLDFRRPDFALEEYIKATTIAIELVPRHSAFPDLQSERGELHRLHTGLLKRINLKYERFEQVKVDIKENNERSGVQPKVTRSLEQNDTAVKKNGIVHGHSRTQSAQVSSSSNASVSGTTPKKKPAVQPKPEALHGKAIPPPSVSGQTDLEARFAKLRGIDPKPVVQDPRIRTQPISIPNVSKSSPNTQVSSQEGNHASTPRLSGPREMPSRTTPHSNKISVDVQVPPMPRAPDAIYSPARSTDNAATANLPSSIARTPSYLASGKTTSAPPISNVGPTPAPAEPRQDYFALSHSVNNHRSTQAPKPRAVFIPESVYISAEDLYKFLGMGSQAMKVLVVDLRSREDFDSGHIMTTSIICIEPIILRRNMSADELAESMILAPDPEQALYSQIEDFDIVVFYDQSSRKVDSMSSSSDDAQMALNNFTAAVYDYGYEKQLKRRPMLLVGGLDAWIDLLGPNSLRVPAGGTSKPSQKLARPIGRVSAVSRGRAALERRKVESRPLTKEEETQWDETLKEDQVMGRPVDADAATSDELFYAKTTDDFFRRFPDISTIQESMVSVAPSPRPLSLYNDELDGTIHQPPTRPAPALPRQRSSGITERGPSAVYATANSVNRPINEITNARVSPGLTGLHNPGVLCYMNSTIQAISATGLLRELLITYKSPPRIPIPPKGDEKTAPPQLMVRNLGNVLGHMWGGQYDWINPKTFAGYVNAIHMGTRTNTSEQLAAFGGSYKQHDASDFFLFLLDILSDELNPFRNLKPPGALTAKEEKSLCKMADINAAQAMWNTHLRYEASPITQTMAFQDLTKVVCTVCGTHSLAFQAAPILNLPIFTNESMTLCTLISEHYGPNSGLKDTPAHSKCERCNKNQKRINKHYFGYFPDYLIITLQKFAWDPGHMESKKVPSLITFPETGIDLTPYFVSPKDASGQFRRGQTGPFLYDCYGVLHHVGRTINGGHFFAIMKSLDKATDGNGAGSWHKYNDRVVSPATFRDTQDRGTYVVLLKRQGAR
ncbi:ubiquitin carboxyl-terminal hydrolase-like protein [Amylocarpus encephaloides]|uniref:Ubiquitin carboxyl-terminal hydrolase-like protein n=1 Tax=Amylocarpus encephaloides TaxID=45428 RepID=A0A9P7Y8U8_9HELO|nr:ubiquitin carboxyl-terminal hydrolase-like protein [Amylocarpus encephaloides]